MGAGDYLLDWADDGDILEVEKRTLDMCFEQNDERENPLSFCFLYGMNWPDAKACDEDEAGWISVSGLYGQENSGVPE